VGAGLLLEHANKVIDKNKTKNFLIEVSLHLTKHRFCH